MTNEEAIKELLCYHREDGTVPKEITLAIKALTEINGLYRIINKMQEVMAEYEDMKIGRYEDE